MKWFILMTTASILALFCNNISATNHHERVKRTQIQSSFVTKLRETPFRLSAGMNTFSHGLFDVLSEKNDGNIIFSPFSLHTALSMVLIGAPNGTRTFKELGTALSIELEHSEDYLYNYLRLLQYYETLQGNSDTKIKFANKAFADDSLKPKANYLTILELFYRSSMQRVDFSDSARAAREINNFVSENTNGLIRDIAQPSHFSDLTRMVLINAIYYKANWKNKFDGAATRAMQFKVRPDLEITHPHGMHLKASLRVADMTSEGFEAKILELPYENENFRMLLILPNENVDDLNMKNLNFGRLKSRLFPATVMLTLPRFKTKQTIQLKDALEELGVSAIFDRSSANLTDIANDDGLFVSDVSHKAFVEVNEAGSEAAAATSIQIDTRSGPVDTVRLAFNKPFLFIIQDVHHNIPLFVGRIVDPTGRHGLGRKKAANQRRQQVQQQVQQPQQQEVIKERVVSLADLLNLPYPPDCAELGYDTSGQTGSISYPCIIRAEQDRRRRQFALNGGFQ